MAIILIVLSLCAWRAAEARGLANHQLINKRYNMAKAAYHQLMATTSKARLRQNWLYCQRSFLRVYEAAPLAKQAPAALLSAGHISFRMYKHFSKKEDLDQALSAYTKVYTLFPKHSYADDALYQKAKILALERQEFQRAALIFAKLLALYPKGDMAPRAALDLQEARKRLVHGLASPPTTVKEPEAIVQRPRKTQTNHPQKRAQVQRIRHWSTKAYTRVVIETSDPVRFKESLLKRDPKKNRRLVIDLKNSHITKKTASAITIDDGLLKKVRSAQHSPDVVRVVLDTQSLEDYHVFTLHDPFRIVVDIKGAPKEAGPPPPKPIIVPNTPSLAQQLGLGIKTIVIDPGHGGKDPGAIGIDGIREKDVVLKVGKLLAQELAQKTGAKIIMTRDRDIFIPLEERTAIANTKDGDLFISIHANSAPNHRAHGVETYYLSMASTKDEMRVAAQENAISSNNISDLHDILKLMQGSKIEESAKLASVVQDSLITGLSRKYGKIGNHGIKKAPFVVLIGAQMPAVLAEIAFVSNKRDAKRLRSDHYLRDVAQEISRGVVKYAQTLEMAAL